jgi:hypothetical protein
MSYLAGRTQATNELKDKYKPSKNCAENWDNIEKINLIITEYMKAFDGSERSKGYIDTYKARQRELELYIKFHQCTTSEQDVLNEITEDIINSGNEESNKDLGGKGDSDSRQILIVGGGILLIATLIIIFKK